LADGRLVDAHGRPATLEGELTPLVRGGNDLAVLAHRMPLPVDPDVVAAAGLALENERLHADAAARLEDLRASRARIVAAGDDERRRLERDLHDGAQQGLVALSLAVRHTRSQVDAAVDPDRAARLDEAARELGDALEDLRKLAHGIFPAVLADEGVEPALETLADETATEIEIEWMPQVRLDRAVETAAYFTVLETLRQTRSARLRIDAALSDRCLSFDLDADGAIDDPTPLEDRVGALDGTVSVQPRPTGVTIRAEIPCGS
jgi:signal transduction histidine kinase